MCPTPRLLAGPACYPPDVAKAQPRDPFVPKELGRFFVGAELEEEFCELAARRIGAAVRGSVLCEIFEVSLAPRAQ